jgi:hypothetical protein
LTLIKSLSKRCIILLPIVETLKLRGIILSVVESLLINSILLVLLRVEILNVGRLIMQCLKRVSVEVFSFEYRAILIDAFTWGHETEIVVYYFIILLIEPIRAVNLALDGVQLRWVLRRSDALTSP